VEAEGTEEVEAEGAEGVEAEGVEGVEAKGAEVEVVVTEEGELLKISMEPVKL
jgi:hypothetical protein